MKGLLPSFVTYFCAGFMLAIPLALAMVFINPVFGLLLVGVYYSWCFFLWDHLRLLRQRELGSALRLALASGLPIDRVLAPEIPAKTVWSWCERAIQWVVPFPFFRPIWDMRYGYLALRKRAADLYLAGQGEEALALPGLLGQRFVYRLFEQQRAGSDVQSFGRRHHDRHKLGILWLQRVACLPLYLERLTHS